VKRALVAVGCSLAVVAAGTLTVMTGAFGASTTLNMNAGDSVHVTCSGPSLSVANQTGTALDLNCAPSPTPTTTAPPPPGVLQIDPSSPPVALADGNNVVGPNGYPFEVHTASFSPPAHALLVAMTAQNNYAPDSYYDTTLSYVDNDPTNLVWTRQARSDWPSSGTEGGAEIWTATTGATAPGPITVSAASNYSQGSDADWLALDVRVVTETDGVTPQPGGHAAASHTGGSPSASLTLSPGSLGFAAVADWSSNGGTAAYGSGLTNIASGQSPRVGSNAPDYAYHFFRSSSGSAGGSTTFNMVTPSQQTWNEAVVEAKLGAA